MRYRPNITRISLIILLASAIALALLCLSMVLLPTVPQPSPSFDCDDAVLTMYRHFQGLGITSTPIIGNLDMDGEEYMECDHVWLLVKTGDMEIAYDWGTPRFDRQHYEGYTISLDYLLYAVERDMQGNDVLASTVP